MPKALLHNDILLHGKIPYAGYRDTLWHGEFYYQINADSVHTGVYDIPIKTWNEWVDSKRIILIEENREEEDMGLIAKSKGTNFDIIKAGLYHAVCYGVVDLGHQFNPAYSTDEWKVLLMWELPGERIVIEGKDLPRAISRKFTLSLNDKALLRPFLESWRGQAFTKEQLEGFDVKKLLGVNCMLNIIHQDGVGKNEGKVFANVSTVVPLPKELIKKAPENPLLYFSFPDKMDIPEHMPEWIFKIIQKSREWEESMNQPSDMHDKMTKNGLKQDDDIPF